MLPFRFVVDSLRSPKRWRGGAGVLPLLLLSCLIQWTSPAQVPTDRVHAFYYPWYLNPSHDGRWEHWDHAIFPQSGPITFHYSPPDEIGASFYPALGPYSSKDSNVLDDHMEQILSAGIGVVNLSWWGSGNYIDSAVEDFIEKAEEHGVRVTFTIEPYGGRSANSVRANIVYLLNKYRNSPALYRHPSRGGLPMFFIYDSYLIDEAAWAQVLSPTGSATLRGTENDVLAFALYVNRDDRSLIVNGHFDGFYTYFATKGFVSGSTPSNWNNLRVFAQLFDKMFMLNVGPGYDDTRVRPWNGENFRDREGGAYYDSFFRDAIDNDPDFIGVTSFNEWHEGTQIETAVPKTTSEFTYRDYEPEDPEYYLRKTRYWVEEWLKRISTGVSNAGLYD